MSDKNEETYLSDQELLANYQMITTGSKPFSRLSPWNETTLLTAIKNTSQDHPALIIGIKDNDDNDKDDTNLLLCYEVFLWKDDDGTISGDNIMVFTSTTEFDKS